jgi:hypothetical protein
MTDKMTLLYVKQTGHVLGAVTREADPDGAITPQALAQGGLLVRGFSTNEQFEVPPEQLNVLTVDLQEVVLLDPRGYVVDEEEQSVGNLPGLTAPTVTLTPKDVTVALATASDVKVWVQIAGASLTQPQVVTGTIPAGGLSVVMQIETLGPGQYQTLTLATDREPKSDTKSIP